MSLQTNVQDFIKRFGGLQKNLGQHFLIDENVSRKIVSSLTDIDTIIEIGPGAGAITTLVKTSGKLILIDKDRRPLDFIESLGLSIDIEYIHKDVLKFNFSKIKKPFSIIGNLPYNISTPLFLGVYFDFDVIPQEFVCMIQKEVGQRILMKSEKPSVLGLSMNLLCDIEKVCDVSRNCFSPKPNVESIVLKLTAKEALPSLEFRKKFLKLITECFQMRRKKMSTIVRDKKLSIVLPDDMKDLRPEDLNIKDWIGLLM